MAEGKAHPLGMGFARGKTAGIQHASASHHDSRQRQMQVALEQSLFMHLYHDRRVGDMPAPCVLANRERTLFDYHSGVGEMRFVRVARKRDCTRPGL